MSWQGDKLKKLRGRLGWCRSDVARYLHVPEADVRAFEENRITFTNEQLHVLDELAFSVSEYSESVHKAPLAESVMKTYGLSYVGDEDLDDEPSALS